MGEREHIPRATTRQQESRQGVREGLTGQASNGSFASVLTKIDCLGGRINSVNPCPLGDYL